MKALWMLLTVFSFLSITIFSGLINTGLVLSETPLIFDSYEKMMEKNVKPTFLKYMSPMKYFIRAREGTPEHKLWTWAKERFPLDHMLRDIDVDTAMKNVIDGAYQKRVFFVLGIGAEVFRTSMCDTFAKAGETGFKKLSMFFPPEHRSLPWKRQVYIRYSDTLKTTMLQTVHSPKSRFTNALRSFLSRMREHGIVEHLVKKQFKENNFLAQLIPKTLLDNQRTDFVLREACRQTIINDGERSVDEMSTVTLDCFKTCLQIFMALLLLCILVFCFETIKDQLTRVSGNGRVQPLKNSPTRASCTRNHRRHTITT